MLSHTCLLLILLLAGIAADTSTSTNDIPTAQLLAKADGLLSSGRVTEALDMYGQAVDREPSSFLNIYKRGTAYLALGQAKRALDDFEAVLGMTELDQARLQASRIQLRLGAYDQASSSISIYLDRNKGDAGATQLRQHIVASRDALRQAERASDKEEWESCVNLADDALLHSPSSTRLHELRSICNSHLGRVNDAAGDITRAVSISANNPLLLVRLSLLNSLFLDQSPQATTPLKQCLHFDPDDRRCKKLFRTLKTLEKDLSRTRNFIESSLWRKALDVLEPRDGPGMVQRIQDVLLEYGDDFVLPSAVHSALLTTLYGWTCKAYVQLGSIRTSAKSCAAVLERDPDNTDGLIGQGEMLLKEEKYEEAVRMLSKAFEATGRSDRVLLEKVQKAQRLLKQSKSKDYYKVLGVSRDADAATIKRAYRKKTKTAHPDKGGSVEAMTAVNEAYEVLSKPELKARFDNGEDPMDPANQQGGGGGHQHGGNPFYGSPGDGMGGEQFFQQFFQQGHGNNPFGQAGGPFAGGGGQRFKFNFG